MMDRGPASDPVSGASNVPPPNYVGTLDSIRLLKTRVHEFQSRLRDTLHSNIGELAGSVASCQQATIAPIAAGIDEIYDGVVRLQRRIAGSLAIRLDALASRIKAFQESISASKDRSEQGSASYGSTLRVTDRTGSGDDTQGTGTTASGPDEMVSQLGSSGDALSAGDQGAIPSTDVTAVQTQTAPVDGIGVGTNGTDSTDCHGLSALDRLLQAGGTIGSNYLATPPTDYPAKVPPGGVRAVAHWAEQGGFTPTDPLVAYWVCDAPSGNWMLALWQKHAWSFPGKADNIIGSNLGPDAYAAFTINAVTAPYTYQPFFADTAPTGPCPASCDTTTNGTDNGTCVTDPCAPGGTSNPVQVIIKPAPEKTLPPAVGNPLAEDDVDDLEGDAGGQVNLGDDTDHCARLFRVRNAMAEIGNTIKLRIGAGGACGAFNADEITKVLRYMSGPHTGKKQHVQAHAFLIVPFNLVRARAVEYCSLVCSLAGGGNAGQAEDLFHLLALLEHAAAASHDVTTSESFNVGASISEDSEAAAQLLPSWFGFTIGVKTTENVHWDRVGRYDAKIDHKATLAAQIVPMLDMLRYLINATIAWKPNTPEMARVRWQAGDLTDNQFRCYVELNGLNWDDYKRFVEAAREKPTTFELIQLFRRGHITRDRMFERMRWNGWLNAGEAFERFQLSDVVPGPSDIVRFMVRNVYDQNIVKAFGLDDEFDQKYNGQLKQWGFASGLGDELAKAHWRAHWQIIPPTQLWRAVQRLRPEVYGNDPAGLRVTLEDVDRALGENDILPFWRRRLLELSYNVLTRNDVRALGRRGVISEEESIKRLQDAGNKKEDAKLLLQLNYSQFALSQLQTQYNYGEIDAAALVFEVKRLGWRDADADMLVKMMGRQKVIWVEGRPEGKAFQAGALAFGAFSGEAMPYGITQSQIDELRERERLRRSAAKVETCRKALRRRFLTGDITIDQLKTYLIGLGIDVSWAVEEANAALCELQTQHRMPALRYLCKWHADGLLSDAELITRLVRIGYELNDARRLAADCIASEKTKREKEDERKQQRQAGKEAKERAAAQKQQTKEAKQKDANDALFARRARKLRKAAEELADVLGGNVADWVSRIATVLDRLIRDYGGSYEIAEAILLDATADVVAGLHSSFASAIGEREGEQKALQPVITQDAGP